jgi:hypothetical protein
MALADYRKNPVERKLAADSVLAIFPRVLKGSFSDADAYAGAASAYAELGDRARAVSEGKRSVAMMPISRDGIRGSANTIQLAYTAALAGDMDLAIACLKQVLQVPSAMSVAVLRTDPAFDPLRSDPRFQALLAGK